MYLDRIICKNTGPIDDVSISFRKDCNGNPIPCIIVGENGSGKSALLSFIVDAFFEFADKGYQNATQKTVKGHQYYRTIASNQIKIGEQWLCTYSEYKDGNEKYAYLFKTGKFNVDEFKNKHEIGNELGLNWSGEGNIKSTNVSETKSTSIFETNIMCYFPPSRYEFPNWMGDKYGSEVISLSNFERYNGHLRNDIIVNNVTEDITQWLLDIIADSRPDVKRVILNKTDSNKTIEFSIDYPSVNDLIALSSARENIEQILSVILGKEIVFRMGHRGASGMRITICEKKTNHVLIPSLDALSTGQMALFLMFSTLVRYGDHLDVNKSIKLENIQGVVVIDEIELHLHGDLQRNAVAKLMRMFPKVQFIISTHAPLVLLGMEQEYKDDLDIIEMPFGKRIGPEQFSQFANAFNYLSETEIFRRQIREAIDNEAKDRAIIVTEGATDWRHMEAAYQSLVMQEEYAWLKELKIRFLEYSSAESADTDSIIKARMSGSELRTMAIDYSRIRQQRKIIFITDRDVQTDIKTFDGEKGYKDWGNNVYSLVLPVPQHRLSTPNISIEFLYMDKDIKQWAEVDGEKRRVFLGNEFRKNGHAYEGDTIYYCKELNAVGPNKMTVIDGSKDKKVIKIGESESEEINYALPKMDFAKMVLKKEKPFDNMDFNGFIPLFKVIKSILEIGNTNDGNES